MSDQIQIGGRHDITLAFAFIFVMLAARTYAAPTTVPSNPPDQRDASLSPMRSLIEHDTSDREALERRYSTIASESGRQRIREFYDQELAKLTAVDFDHLDQPGRIDYLLLRNKLQYDQKQLDYRHRQMQ